MNRHDDIRDRINAAAREPRALPTPKNVELPHVGSTEWMDAGEKLCKGLDAIRHMLYGLALDARQACIAQKAIDEAVDARREWDEKKASTVS